MGQLNTLTTELLLKIIVFIPDSSTVNYAQDPYATWGVPRRPLADYCSLALTCHSINRAVIPILYEKYDHTWAHLTSIKFIVTLGASPDLADLVKEMKEIGCKTQQWKPENFDPKRINRRMIKSVCTKIRALQVSKTDTYIDLFNKQRDRIQNLQAALIAVLTPNIEAISVNSCPGPEKASRTWPYRWKLRHSPAELLPILHAARGIPYGKVHSFNNLRKLKIRMLGLQINSISPILQHKALRDLILYAYTEPGFDLDKPPCSWECLPKSLNIRNIGLENFDFRIGSLQALLSACQLLSVFSFIVPSTNTPAPQWFQLTTILKTYQPGLEALCIEDKRGRPRESTLLRSL